MINADRSLRILVVLASRRTGRLGPTILDWVRTQTEHQQSSTEYVELDLGALDLPDHLRPGSHHVELARKHVADADGFLFIVPEYNRGIPGPVKTFIDHFNAEWQAKPVAIVSYGLSISGGLRAAEHLRQVFSEFHAVTVRDGLVFPAIDRHLNAAGTFCPLDVEGTTIATRLMLRQLTWWAAALQSARNTTPLPTS